MPESLRTSSTMLALFARSSGEVGMLPSAFSTTTRTPKALTSTSCTKTLLSTPLTASFISTTVLLVSMDRRSW